MADSEDEWGENHKWDEDLLLPIEFVLKHMDDVLPKQANLNGPALDAVQMCASEFISLVTSEAAEKCAFQKKDIIDGNDVISCLDLLGFEDYIQPLTIYLKKFRKTKMYSQLHGLRGNSSGVVKTGSDESETPVGSIKTSQGGEGESLKKDENKGNSGFIGDVDDRVHSSASGGDTMDEDEL